jgi:hypothetical protein
MNNGVGYVMGENVDMPGEEWNEQWSGTCNG